MRIMIFAIMMATLACAARPTAFQTEAHLKGWLPAADQRVTRPAHIGKLSENISDSLAHPQRVTLEFVLTRVIRA